LRVDSIHSEVHALELSRPYTIAFRRIEAIELVVTRVYAEDGSFGLGAASPESHVTGETNEVCQSVLDRDQLGWLIGTDFRSLPAVCRRLRAQMPQTPAARAALDIALHDLVGKSIRMPLVEMLGRAHDRLPTSVTIGILGVEDTLREAREHADNGFRVLKIKLGHSVDEDIERLRMVRHDLGRDMLIRVDPNQGYDTEQLEQFVDQTSDLALEFIEQPMKADAISEVRALPDSLRRKIALDESLLDSSDALQLAAPPAACGIFNIKLMKCGGIHEALRIATIADCAGIDLMWGCMDESAISIAAALHAALASPATRYLDLDGSFDLARDVVTGGFVLKDGMLSTNDEPGLGVTWTG
jgi:L-alanine-DL-glutamate epimerase-like enolase superfamily enzyme